MAVVAPGLPGLAGKALPRLSEVRLHKESVRAMIAAAYDITEEDAKEIIHAMTNGIGGC